MFCNNCGKQNPDGARFCNFCGAAVTAPVRTSIQAPPQNIKATQKPSMHQNNRLQAKVHKPWYTRWWIWTIIGLVVTVAAITLSVFIFSVIKADSTEAKEAREYWLNYAQTHEFEEISRDVLFDKSYEYKDKHIITSIRIYKKGITDEGEGTIKAEAADGSWLFYDLDFIFENSKEVMNYNKGDYITVMGKVKGRKGLISTVEVIDCHIIDVGESSKVKMKELEKE